MTIIDKWGRKILLRSPRFEIYEVIKNYRHLLSERSFIIAKLYYSYGFTDLEISVLSSTTHQNISKIRRNLISKISRKIEKNTAARKRSKKKENTREPQSTHKP